MFGCVGTPLRDRKSSRVGAADGLPLSGAHVDPVVAGNPAGTTAPGLPHRSSVANRGSRVSRRRRGSAGQALVEFSLVLPIFIFMLLAIIEFAFVFNAILGISFATRDAALVAAEAGNAANADCAILKVAHAAIGPPMNPNKVEAIVIYRTDTNGSLATYAGQTNTYVPGGTLNCQDGDGTTFTLPFTLSGSEGYLQTSRCNVLAGCGNGRALDYIGVRITYRHSWLTPLGGIGGPSGTSVTVTQSNSMRMEPIL
jgi:Flp pilus assembly protein TadG